MRKRYLNPLLFFLLSEFFITFQGIAVERVTVVGARDVALSMAVVSLPGSFSVFNNQALLAGEKNISLGLSYRQPYFIRGYDVSALSLVCPVGSTVLALGLTQSKIATYDESGFGISIAKILTRKLSAGLLLNYFSVGFPEAGLHKGSFQSDFGLHYQPADKLSIGFHVQNLITSNIETFQSRISFPRVIRGGASGYLTDRILLAAEAVTDADLAIGVHCGIEYALHDNFRVRGGISTKPMKHSFGFGYKLSRCKIDFAMVHHEMLGYTPVFSIICNLR